MGKTADFSYFFDGDTQRFEGIDRSTFKVEMIAISTKKAELQIAAIKIQFLAHS